MNPRLQILSFASGMSATLYQRGEPMKPADAEDEKMARIKRASVRGNVNIREAEGVLAPAATQAMKVTVSGSSREEEMSLVLDPAEYVGQSVVEIRDRIKQMCSEEGFDADDANSSAQEVYDYAQLLVIPEPEFGFDPDL